jgi:hypothetical protein
MVAIVNKSGGARPSRGERGSNRTRGDFFGRLLKALQNFIKRERYEPAKHYMRGPGPASSQRSNQGKGEIE